MYRHLDLGDDERAVRDEQERDARDHDPETCPDCQACELADAAELEAWRRDGGDDDDEGGGTGEFPW